MIANSFEHSLICEALRWALYVATTWNHPKSPISGKPYWTPLFISEENVVYKDCIDTR